MSAARETHCHVGGRERAYTFVFVDQLVEDFIAAVAFRHRSHRHGTACGRLSAGKRSCVSTARIASLGRCMLRTAGLEVQFGVTRTSLTGYEPVSVADSIADVQPRAHEPSLCAEVRPARLHFRVLGLAVGRPVLPGCSTPSPIGPYRNLRAIAVSDRCSSRHRSSFRGTCWRSPTWR